MRLKSLYGGGYHLKINCVKDFYLKQLRALHRRKLRKSKEKERQDIEKKKASDLRPHPAAFEEEEKKGLADDEIDMNKDKDENEECFDLKQIHSNLKNYIKGLIPNADIIGEFNGNFSYLIPYEGFNASYVYT